MLQRAALTVASSWVRWGLGRGWLWIAGMAKGGYFLYQMWLKRLLVKREQLFFGILRTDVSLQYRLKGQAGKALCQRSGLSTTQAWASGRCQRGPVGRRGKA